MSILRHLPDTNGASALAERPSAPPLEEQPELQPELQPEGQSVGAGAAPVLVAEHLYKDFPVHGGMPFRQRRAVHAVQDVTVYLRPGRVTALVGESGSGKTTVARLLAGLYPATSGAVRFHGRTVGARGGMSLREYRRQVQLVFQDPFASLNPIHTVRYHLSRPLRVHGHAQGAAEEEAQLKALLARVSLTPAEMFLAKYPHELSGGQRQRVSIARALAARPSVLLADEPVSMLDVSIRLEILNLLRRLKEEDQIAVLYITHDIASAYYFADDVLVMYRGQVVERGSSDAVIQHPQHAYTQLLLNSAPDPERVHGRRAPVAVTTPGDAPGCSIPPGDCRLPASTEAAADERTQGSARQTAQQTDQQAASAHLSLPRTDSEPMEVRYDGKA
jgi:peptide/nickel transport system ATP-binding protein